MFPLASGCRMQIEAPMHSTVKWQVQRAQARRGGDNSSPMKSTNVACMHMLAYVVRSPTSTLYDVRVQRNDSRTFAC
jgi:hypothetical protein